LILLTSVVHGLSRFGCGRCGPFQFLIGEEEQEFVLVIIFAADFAVKAREYRMILCRLRSRATQLPQDRRRHGVATAIHRLKISILRTRRCRSDRERHR